MTAYLCAHEKLLVQRVMPRFSFPACCLVIAFGVYGVLSSPTPDIFGWAEALIGVLLILAVGISRGAAVGGGWLLVVPRSIGAHNNTEKILAGAFCLLLFVPLVVGVLAGHDARDSVRDAVPLLYFFLMLFLYRADATMIPALTWGMIMIGVCFALRFWPASGLTLTRFGLDRGNDEMLYLTSSPLVMAAGIFLGLTAVQTAPVGVLRRVLAGFFALVCLLTLAATLQRAAMVLTVAVLLPVVVMRMVASARFCLGVLAMLMLTGPLWVGTAWDLGALIIKKTAEVGDNARLAELTSVLAVMGHDPVTWLLGRGWGATVVTAASGYAEVRYTHMFPSYMLFKAGLLGVLAMGAVVVVIARAWWRTLWRNARVALAVWPGVILGLTLYPSFKMLDFGVMLALLVLIARPDGVPMQREPDAGF